MKYIALIIAAALLGACATSHQEERANAVRAYLISKGADASKISAKGYGESQPTASNDTEAGRAQNRRVELRQQ